MSIIQEKYSEKEKFVNSVIKNLEEYGEFTFYNRNISMIHKGFTRISNRKVTFHKDTYGIEGSIEEQSWYDSNYPYSSFNFGRNWQDQDYSYYSEDGIRKYLMTVHLSDLYKGTYRDD